MPRKTLTALLPVTLLMEASAYTSWMAAALLANVSGGGGGRNEKSPGVRQKKWAALHVWGTREAQVWYWPVWDTDLSWCTPSLHRSQGPCAATKWGADLAQGQGTGDPLPSLIPIPMTELLPRGRKATGGGLSAHPIFSPQPPHLVQKCQRRQR